MNINNDDVKSKKESEPPGSDGDIYENHIKMPKSPHKPG